MDRSLRKSAIGSTSPPRRILHEATVIDWAICNLGNLLAFRIKRRRIDRQYSGPLSCDNPLQRENQATDALKNARGSAPARAPAENLTRTQALLFPQGAHRIALRPNASCQRRQVVDSPRRSGPPRPEPVPQDRNGRPAR